MNLIFGGIDELDFLPIRVMIVFFSLFEDEQWLKFGGVDNTHISMVFSVHMMLIL